MNVSELLPLLLGSTGALVLSLTLNVLFIRGTVTGANSVPKPQHDRVLNINERYADRFGEQSEAVRALAQSQVMLTDRLERVRT